MILDTNALSAFADDVPTVVQQIGSITSRFVKGDSSLNASKVSRLRIAL